MKRLNINWKQILLNIKLYYIVVSIQNGSMLVLEMMY